MANLKITHEDAIHLLENQKQKITRFNSENDSIVLGLIGHPYMINDETLNHHIKTKLRQFNASLITPEMLPAAELREGLRYMNTSNYWISEEDVVGAGGHYIKNGLDGIIGVMAFGCGPDSLMMHLVERKARVSSIPYMCLTFDEHTAAAGIVTRLEAFLDMIKRRPLRRRSNLDACCLSAYR